MEIPPLLAPYARTLVLPRSKLRLFFYDSAEAEGSEAAVADLPVLFLVHGLSDEADSWQRVIASLANRYRVIAPDLPGFGRSDLPARALITPRFLSRVLVELLDCLGIARAELVGSSLGGMLVQLVALERPELAERLVLVDGSLTAVSRLSGSMLSMVLPGRGRRRFKSLSENNDAAYASLEPYYANLEALPEGMRAFLYKRVGDRVKSKTQLRAYVGTLRGMVAWGLFGRSRALRRAARLTVPTVYLWGAEDHIIPLASGRAAWERQPGARSEVIPGAGHLPHQERPELFVRALLGAQVRSAR